MCPMFDHPSIDGHCGGLKITLASVQGQEFPRKPGHATALTICP